MTIEDTRQLARALWRYTVRDDDGVTHDVIVYRVPSVTAPLTWCNPTGGEGPSPWRNPYGWKTWYEVLVDGEWAHQSGHEAYATREDALATALERIAKHDVCP